MTHFAPRIYLIKQREEEGGQAINEKREVKRWRIVEFRTHAQASRWVSLESSSGSWAAWCRWCSRTVEAISPAANLQKLHWSKPFLTSRPEENSRSLLVSWNDFGRPRFSRITDVVSDLDLFETRGSSVTARTINSATMQRHGKPSDGRPARTG